MGGNGSMADLDFGGAYWKGCRQALLTALPTIYLSMGWPAQGMAGEGGLFLHACIHELDMKVFVLHSIMIRILYHQHSKRQRSHFSLHLHTPFFSFYPIKAFCFF